MTRIVGSPSSHAADATSARASAYDCVCGDRWAARALRVAVGAPRQRRPRLAASKKSWAAGAPGGAPQSAAARGADSATAAASARASSRAAPASPPAVVASAATASTASVSVAVVDGLDETSRPAGGWRLPGIRGAGAAPTSSSPPAEADPNFSARNLP